MNIASDTSAVQQGLERMGRREREVLTLAGQGKTDKEISVELGISRDTVSTYWRRILLRFGASSRTEVVAKVAASLDDARLAAFTEETAQLRREIGERTEAQARELAQRNLLEAISTTSLSLLAGQVDFAGTFESLLSSLLALTESEYGFIAEVHRDDEGAPYMRTQAITNIAWDRATRDLYERESAAGLVFRNLQTLFGVALRTGRPVISNQPAIDPRRGGLPPGHPPLEAYLGLPVYLGFELVGMIGLANRPGGYDEALIKFLRPIVTTCANLIHAKRLETDRIAAEKRSANAAARLKALVSQLQSAVLFEDEDRKILIANEAFCRMFRVPVPPDAIVGLDCALAMLTSKELFADPASASARVDELVRNGESVYGERLMMADGRVLSRDFCRTQAPGGLGGYLWHYRDITREHADLSILEAVLRCSMDAVIVMDEGGRALFWNDQATELFGYRAEEAMGRTISELIVPEQYRAQHLAGLSRYLATGVAKVFGQRIGIDGMRKDGSLVPVELLISAVPCGDRQVFSATIRAGKAPDAMSLDE